MKGYNAEHIAIICTNKDGFIYQFNEGAEALLGYSPSEIIGLKKHNSFLVDEEFEKFKNDIAYRYEEELIDVNPYQLLAHYDGSDSREWTIIKKDGTSFIAHSTITPLKNESGESTGYLIIIKNITDQKIIETELLRKNQVLNVAEKITMMGNWQWDTITNDVEWSSNLYSIFEVDPSKKITFDTYSSFVHPDDKETVSIAVEKTINDKIFYPLLHRIKLTSGKVKTIQLLGEVLTDDANNVIELIGTCQDVTQQRMAEIKFKGLLESAPDAMVIVNEQGKIQLINKQAEKLFGYSSEELINKHVEFLIPERFKNKHTSHRKMFFKLPKTREMGGEKELYGINKQGEEMPIQISLSPLKTEEGLLVSAAIRDITLKKKAEEKIIVAKENLEILAKKLTAQNIQLADFAQITSHNLRAPVSNLNSLLNYYKTSKTDEDKTIVFEKFETVIDHLTVTLDTLVEALTIKNESNKNLETLLFNDILNKTEEILSCEISKTGAKITTDFSENPSIDYNKIYLESIFLNLVSNAIKYKSEDRSPEIFIQSVIEDGTIKLKFKDNGLGVNLERHGHKIFGLNKVFHRHPDAKGIGLFMTKVQIESMGGKISIESDVNVGSTFSITLMNENE